MPEAAVPAPVGSTNTLIPLGDKPFVSPYYSIGTEVCQNMYLEQAQSTSSRASYYLLKIPGLRRFGQVPVHNYGACRGMFTCSNGRTFSVHGNNLFEIVINGSLQYIASINSYSGHVSMAENGSLLMLVDGNSGWILRFSDDNFTRIMDEYFPGNDLGTLAPTTVTFLDTYFIVNIPNTNQYYYSTSYYVRDHDNISTPYNPIEVNGYWTPLSSGQKIGKTDNITAIVNCNNYLWLFGYNSCEIHFDTGNYNGQLFARYQGSILNIGCSSPNSVAVYANNLFFLGTDNSGTLGVFTNDGLQPSRISTRGIEQIIESMSTYVDCKAYTYAQAGHAFYVMQFPTANRTFVFDIVTNSWHERTKLIRATGALQRWDGLYATNNFGTIIIGDSSSSAIYQLDPTYYKNDNPTDSGYNYIRCVKTTPISFQAGVNLRYNSIQVICNQGSGVSVGEDMDAGVDPTLQVAWSDDCGIIYGNERSAPIGKQGETTKRSRIMALGISRNRVWKITMTAPVPFILVALVVNGSSCRF